jgi:nitrogen fixation protein NifU and related proteins
VLALHLFILPHYNPCVYSAKLLDHFEHPRHAGVIDNHDAIAQLENPVCGDILELTAKIANGRLTEICFRAKGCVPTMACASAITELAKGKNIDEARMITREQVAQAVDGLPEASSHAAVLALDVLRTMLHGR